MVLEFDSLMGADVFFNVFPVPLPDFNRDREFFQYGQKVMPKSTYRSLMYIVVIWSHFLPSLAIKLETK